MKYLLLYACCCLYAVVAPAAVPKPDPALEAIKTVAHQNASRYEVIRKTVYRYDPAKTNVFARPARASMQTKLDTARAKALAYWTDYTNQVVRTVAYSNAMVVAQRVAASATAKIEDEIDDLEAKIVKYREYQSKYPLLKSIFAAMITDAENRISVLESLANAKE